MIRHSSDYYVIRKNGTSNQKLFVTAEAVEAMNIPLDGTTVVKNGNTYRARPAKNPAGKNVTVELLDSDGTKTTMHCFGYHIIADTVTEIEEYRQQYHASREAEIQRNKIINALMSNYKERLEQLTTEQLADLAILAGAQV